MRVKRESKKYSDFYKTEFGEKILERELEYVSLELGDCRDVLSVGCGPAYLEAGLMQLKPRMNIVGLDISEEMLKQVPHTTHGLDTVLGKVECAPFRDGSFEAVIYIASLEFIYDYEKAIEETVRVLKPKGRLLILIINTRSDYFRREYGETGSYINKNFIHTNVVSVVRYLSSHFSTRTEYFLGIDGEEVFDTDDPEWASIHVIKGARKEGID